MILDSMPFTGGFGNYGNFMENIKLKDECNKKGMFTYVSWRWINPFAEWIGDRKCLEVMAGAGYLSYALREKGVSVIATDNMSWHETTKWKLVTDVEKRSANRAIAKYGKKVDIVIMGWPYMDAFAFKALRCLHYVNPKALMVYIGESCGGCTADDSFFNHFEHISDLDFERVSSNFEQFTGMHDYPYLGRYKTNQK
jgi:hypothetical protein